MNTQINFNWNDIKSKILEVYRFLPTYLKNPLEGIKSVPQWDWWTIIILDVLLGAVCGFLSGIVSRHILAIFGGLILEPITSVLVSFIFTGLMYYICLFWLKVELDFRKAFIVVVLAKLPAEILSILSPIARPITILGMIAMAALLIVGFTANFGLEKKKVTQIIGALTLISALFWLYTLATDISTTRIKVQDYTPESLDQINKELGE